MMHRLLFRKSGQRHTIYLRVEDGIVRGAPTLYQKWIGQKLDRLRAALPKSHKYQVWGEKAKAKK